MWWLLMNVKEVGAIPRRRASNIDAIFVPHLFEIRIHVYNRNGLHESRIGQPTRRLLPSEHAMSFLLPTMPQGEQRDTDIFKETRSSLGRRDAFYKFDLLFYAQAMDVRKKHQGAITCRPHRQLGTTERGRRTIAVGPGGVPTSPDRGSRAVMSNSGAWGPPSRTSTINVSSQYSGVGVAQDGTASPTDGLTPNLPDDARLRTRHRCRASQVLEYSGLRPSRFLCLNGVIRGN